MNIHSRISLAAALLCLTALLSTSRATAQGLGRISGIVTDSTGAAVAGARVTAARNGTGEVSSAVSDGSGAYVFPALAPAQYTITATASGFSTFVQSNTALQADQAVTINAELKPGAASETITVTDTPPQIDTTTGTLSQVIDEKRVNDLPLNGRNAATLTTLVPGVVVASSLNIDQGLTKTSFSAPAG